MTFYKQSESQRESDLKRGASHIPGWVNFDRLCGESVRMVELDYWINYTNRVPLNRKLSLDEWKQVKIFNLPKKTLKLQVEPEHLDVFLSTVKCIKPRKNNYNYIILTIYDLEWNEIIRLSHVYGRFVDSYLNEDFKFERAAKHESYEYACYIYKNKYEIQVCNCYFNEDQ